MSETPSVPAVPPALPAAAGVAAAGVVAALGAPPAHCTNCDAPLAGRYCSACGQRREPPLHSLWHFCQVAAEDLTHADSRLWRTLLALLLKPGYLTHEFLAGRRARFLPPLRLYLVLSVLFFLWASATHPRLEVVTLSEQGAQRTELSGRAESVTPLSPARPGESAEARAERLCHDANYDGPWRARIGPLVPKLCRKAVSDNGRALREAFLHNVPRAMFVFLPLLAGAMMLMYWRPRHYYIEHLLLFVHYHAFVFVALMLKWLIETPLPALEPLVSLVFGLYIPWYLFRSMRVVYGQGRVLTFAKFLGLTFFYLVSGALMLGITTIYSVLTL
jgi:Protein of unknown function (DUF3667)